MLYILLLSMVFNRYEKFLGDYEFNIPSIRIRCEEISVKRVVQKERTERRKKETNKKGRK